MKIYVAHCVDDNFQEKEVITKPYFDFNILVCLCNFVAQTFTHIGFWIEEKEIQMKVYVVLVDYKDGRDSKVYGVYKNYRHAFQEKERVIELGKTLWGGDQIKARIIDSKITE